MSSSADFYASLAPFRKFSEVMDDAHYRRVPDDWHVIITDVKGATKAIENDRYKDVNLLGAASIIAVLNALKGRQIPFVFGGDGATILVHCDDLEKITRALLATYRLARDVFGFELRIGIVAIADLSERSHLIEVAKYEISDTLSIATIRGGGIAHAEKLIKQKSYYRLPIRVIEMNDSTFEGLSCRWNPVRSKYGKMMSLLVAATGSERPESVFKRVVAELQVILDDPGVHPVEASRIDRRLSFRNVAKELRLHLNGLPLKAKIKTAFEIIREVFYMRIFVWTGMTMNGFNANRYFREMSDNTDYQKFDDMIRMVRDVSQSQIDRIKAVLERERQNGSVAYGVHFSNEALMTCLVFSLDHHIHFVDGSGGGYALAAKQLKEQLRIARGE